jgi:hypothetical protein
MALHDAVNFMRPFVSPCALRVRREFGAARLVFSSKSQQIV